ncbi:MAG: aldo/keto reductase [Myxococcota bacterium]
MRLGTLHLHQSDDPDGLLRAAEALGVAGVDCADVYGDGPPHEAERCLETSLPVQTKGGLLRKGSQWRPCGTAKHLTARARGSLAALGRIPLYFLHVVDPDVGLDRSWRALQKLRDDGVIGGLGLSNPRYDDVVRALELGGLDAVQVALSPFKLDALEAGLVRLCHEHGVAVQAHSPLGGWRRKNRTVRAFRDLCAEHGVSHERLTLRWLESLGVEPVVGCTRVETLTDAMGPVPPEVVQAARDAIPESALADGPVATSEGDGHVVLVLGLQAAGKTTHARGLVDAGYARLNRDELGGTLTGLVHRLDDLLASGERRVVLDNTWADRHIRHRAVRVATRHGCRVTAIHVDTPFEQCVVQAIRRILADGGGLPEPEQLKSGDPPHFFGPSVLFGLRSRFEPPTRDEGFALQTVAAPPLEWPQGSETAIIASLDALEQRTFDGPVYGAVWIPDTARQARLDAVLRRHDLAGLRVCRHPPGPAVCWCRKPLPGMAIDLMLAHGLNPRQTVLIGGSAEKAVARHVGACFEPL